MAGVKATPVPATLPDPPAPPTVDRRAIRVTAKQDMRRRAGCVFTPEPQVFGQDEADALDVHSMVGDRLLFVEVTIDGESWHPLDPSSFASPEVRTEG